MDILLIGGPKFLGRALIDAALAAGHTVTMFNRGRTNQHLYPQVERLQGDRDGNLGALRGRQWDVVIDTCGYVPRVVRLSAELLAGAVKQYIFVSTISVYAEPLEPGADEDAPLAVLADPATEQITGETYGGLKALCERVVLDVYAGRALIIRPGLIVGPHDPTNRFTYWVTRTADGGPVLAPDDRDAPVQVIDVRDLAQWILHMAPTQGGVYNATGPAAPLTLGKTLETCREVARAEAGVDAEFVWVPPQFLLGEGVAPWTELPLWVAGDDALNTVSIARALAHGLALRPPAVTIADTLAWARSQQPEGPPHAGLAREREAELLAKYLNLDLEELMSTITHLTTAQLEAGLEHIRRSPKDKGMLEMIVRRPQVGEREVLKEGELDLEVGLVGDTWLERGSSRTGDGSAHPDMQINVINARLLDLVAQDKARWPLAGDQLVVDFDLSEENIPPGTQLSIGSAIIEVTAQPHTGCQKFVARFGKEAMLFVNSPVGKQLHLRGINARVVKPGTIRQGDAVHKGSS